MDKLSCRIMFCTCRHNSGDLSSVPATDGSPPVSGSPTGSHDQRDTLITDFTSPPGGVDAQPKRLSPHTALHRRFGSLLFSIFWLKGTPFALLVPRVAKYLAGLLSAALGHSKNLTLKLLSHAHSTLFSCNDGYLTQTFTLGFTPPARKDNASNKTQTHFAEKGLLGLMGVALSITIFDV